MPSRFSSSVLIRDSRFKRVAGWAILGCLILAPILIGASSTFDNRALAHVSVWMLGLMLVFVIVYIVALTKWASTVTPRAEKVLKEATIEVTTSELIVHWSKDGRKPRSFALSSIVSAWRGDEDRAEIVLANRSELVIRGLSPQDLHAFFRALGTNADERTAVTSVASVGAEWSGCITIPALVTLPITGCAGFIALMVLVPGLIGLGELVLEYRFDAAAFVLMMGLAVNLIVFGSLYSLIEIYRPRRLIVGTDGLALTSFGRRTFYSMGRIKEVRYESKGVRIIFHDRSDLRFYGAPEALAHRIQEAMDVGGESDSLAPRLGLLDRGGRDIEVWKASLRKLVENQGHYRKAAFQPEQLTALAVDADASPERRVAAAYALSTMGEENSLESVRKASKACADDHLRCALEDAIEGKISDHDLEKVIKRH